VRLRSELTGPAVELPYLIPERRLAGEIHAARDGLLSQLREQVRQRSVMQRKPLPKLAPLQLPLQFSPTICEQSHGGTSIKD
jgi:hypothetical protein